MVPIKMPEESVKWYQKKEIWAGIIFLTGGVKYFSSPNTVAHQLADYTISVGIPLALGVLGVKDGIKNKSLPGGLSKLYQSIKDRK
ncbi:MAG: hypothetical protein B6D44_15215 [Ignavibacteriales bacterium UTCHB2]|jgi:hypothetical protein|nr:MAG: hypothetical protein B6D44_15215 [Ignavibacteriales bacterium UTCHB2]